MKPFNPSLRKVLSIAAAAMVLAISLPVALAQTDTEAPSYVSDVAATPGDGEVILSWSATTDDVAVTGYKIYIGTEAVDEVGESYNMDPIEAGNVLEYTVTDLENDITYYFSVTALDDAGNESADYSEEASATPTDGSGDDGTHPTVLGAEATNCTVIEVTFSEAVAVPDEFPEEAFTIEDLDTLLYLTVEEASVSSDDSSIVVLNTDTMIEGNEYFLTVGIEVEDLYGNALVSGTSDQADFIGVTCADETTDTTSTDTEIPGMEDEDVTAPLLEAIEATSLTEVQLTFDEVIVLPEDLEIFEIFDDDDNLIEVLEVEAVGDYALTLTTAEHTAETEYFITVTGLLDEAGNATIGDFNSAGTYTSPAAENDEDGDEDAPEDVTDFIADVVDMIVGLSWESSVDSAGDLVDQILYVSSDDGETYEVVEELDEDITEYTYEGGVEGETYSFMLTTVDEDGNESTGTVVTTTLPTTGAGIALLVATSLLGGGALSRRRKKQQ